MMRGSSEPEEGDDPRRAVRGEAVVEYFRRDRTGEEEVDEAEDAAPEFRPEVESGRPEEALRSRQRRMRPSDLSTLMTSGFDQAFDSRADRRPLAFCFEGLRGLLMGELLFG